MNQSTTFPDIPLEKNRKDIFELPEITNNRRLLGLANKFKNYCTIRRDLRDANHICEYVIDVHKKLLDGSLQIEGVANSIFLVRAAQMHAVVLYSRWFKDTTKKPQLSPSTFFSNPSVELDAHIQLLDLRDKYIAHNEMDILGRDRVWVEFCDNGKVSSIGSDWVEQQIIQINNLNMNVFQRCIHLVHNKIDAEILPDIQQRLKNELNINCVIV